MREIKFRAWDGKSVRYDVTGFEHGAANEMAGIFLNGDFYHIGGDSPVDACADVMQYTGLVDKNGKEIYEGDIMGLDGDAVAAITFMDGAFQLIANQSQGRSPFIQERAKWYEIIGNIYENPELLGEQ